MRVLNLVHLGAKGVIMFPQVNRQYLCLPNLNTLNVLLGTLNQVWLRITVLMLHKLSFVFSRRYSTRWLWIVLFICKTELPRHLEWQPGATRPRLQWYTDVASLLNGEKIELGLNIWSDYLIIINAMCSLSSWWIFDRLKIRYFVEFVLSYIFPL